MTTSDWRGQVDLFSTIAPCYDRMNMVISLGLLPRWHRALLLDLGLSSGMKVIDVCCGTGTLTELAREAVGETGSVVGIDLCPEMLAVARRRMSRRGWEDVRLEAADAAQLPLEDGSCDRAVLGFALRNVKSARAVLAEMRRVLRPRGVAAVIELSHPPSPVVALAYRLYRHRLLPTLDFLTGQVGHRPYRYLGRSLDGFCGAAALASMMEEVGFSMVSFRRLAGGAVAVHRGFA